MVNNLLLQDDKQYECGLTIDGKIHKTAGIFVSQTEIQCQGIKVITFVILHFLFHITENTFLDS